MKILIMTGELYPHLNANSVIAYQIASELSKHPDCDVRLLGWYEDPKDRECEDPYGLRTYSLESMEAYKRVTRSRGSKPRKLAQFLFTPRVLSIYRRMKRKTPYQVLNDEYFYTLKKILKQDAYDCLIGFSTPYNVLEVIDRIRTDVPIVSYMLDPWSTCFLCRDYAASVRVKELRIARNVDAIITSKLIRKDYEEILGADASVLSKIHVLEYPNIAQIRCEEPVLPPPDGKIRCVFTGKLYADIRSPDYAFSLFRALGTEETELHIYGRLPPDAGPLPDNVVFHGEVPTAQANAQMLSADVLVNIGNTVTNLMPSKIFTYMSSGRPILNLYKKDDCPTLGYLSDYPLALSVRETPEPEETDIERIRTFLRNAKGKSVPFDTVADTFRSCTSSFVGEEVYRILSSLREKKHDARQ